MPSSTCRRRVGLVVPPSNPTVEPEIHRLVADSVDVYAARLPVLPELDLADRLVHYVSDLPDALTTLRGLRLSATFFACTGSTYGMSAAVEEELRESSAAVAGCAVHTAASALGEVLGALDVRSLRLVSPYPAWLGDRCAAYWAQRGLEVLGLTQVQGADGIYDLSSEDVLGALDDVLALQAERPSEPHRTAVVVVGTGAPSLRALELRALETSTPVLSTNVAAAWLLLRSVGVDPSTCASPVLRRLTEHVDAAVDRLPAVRPEESHA